LRRHGLLAGLLPTVDAYLKGRPGSVVEKLLLQGLKNTDARVVADKPVTPTFLFALLLYGPIAQIIEATPPERWHELSTILDACDKAAREAQTHVAIPKRFILGVREMFGLQPRLEHPRGRRALRGLEHPRFRAAAGMLPRPLDLSALACALLRAAWCTGGVAPPPPPQARHRLGGRRGCGGGGGRPGRRGSSGPRCTQRPPQPQCSAP